MFFLNHIFFKFKKIWEAKHFLILLTPVMTRLYTLIGHHLFLYQQNFKLYLASLQNFAIHNIIVISSWIKLIDTNIDWFYYYCMKLQEYVVIINMTLRRQSYQTNPKWQLCQKLSAEWVENSLNLPLLYAPTYSYHNNLPVNFWLVWMNL